MYWKGFEDGKQSSLKHNINLMKSQIKIRKGFVELHKAIRQVGF